MALSGKQGALTRAVNALQKAVDKTNQKIPFWKELPDDTVIIHKRDMEEMEFLLKSKAETLESTWTKFAVTVDNIHEDEKDAITAAEKHLDKANEVMDNYHSVKDQLAFQLQRLKVKNCPTPPITNPLNEPIVKIVDRQNLPKLPRFKGNAWEFSNFWALFEELVDQNQWTELVKFNKLMESLEGDAKLIVSKYISSDNKYQLAVDHLQRRYNNKEAIIAELTSQLKKEKATSFSTKDQRHLLDRILCLTNQLKDLQENIESRMLKDEIIGKFANRIREAVFMKKKKSRADWTIDRVMQDLEEAIESEEELNRYMGREDVQKDNRKHWKNDNTPYQSTQTPKSDKKPFPCIFCKKEGHRSHECRTVVSQKDRQKILEAEKRCRKCLSSNHTGDKCNKSSTCFNCKSKEHHAYFCNKQKANESNAKDKTALQPKEQRIQAITISRGQKCQESDESTRRQADDESQWYHNEYKTGQDDCKANIAHKDHQTFIPTIEARAYNPRDRRWTPIVMMLDTGSDQSYIRTQVFKDWNLPNMGTHLINTRVFGSEAPETKEHQRTKLRLKTEDNMELEMELYTIPNLAGTIQKSQLSKEDMRKILQRKWNVNEDVFKKDTEPTLLIGCDYLGQILEGQIQNLPSGISIIRTKMGYTTMGKQITLKKSESDMQICMVNQKSDITRIVEDNQKMDMQMKTPEEFTGPLTQEQSAADKKTIKFFEDTIEKRENGYYVRLPMIENHPTLSDNFSVAISRLQKVQGQYSEDILQKMQDVFSEQEERGYIERVDLVRGDTTGHIHYNPCQPVITPQKTTTKCRVVVDGSSHQRNKPSLNDVIQKGPVILPDMVDMLIRFRTGHTVIIADIEKAFLQVFLHEDDRDYTRVLWLRDIQKTATIDNIIVYRFTRVLFGLNVSPFLLAGTILHHLKKQKDKKLANEISSNLYVDNMMLTTDLKGNELIVLYKLIKTIFIEAGMNMREFKSNSEKFNNAVNEEDRAKDSVMKVLGIEWSSTQDNIIMKTICEDLLKNSRRTVSSTIASIYDPLGLLTPLMIHAKLFQRDNLWDNSYGWDTELSEEHNRTWTEIIKEINGFEVALPRNVIEKSKNNTIVTFTDASKEATACCIYVVNELGSHLIHAKSKIKPLKEAWTIPKLETQALKMGVDKTLKTIKALKEGSIEVDSVIILSDSTIALDWLRSNPGRDKSGIFITNRIRSIVETTNEIEDHGIKVRFGHVTTDDNPADLGTRGCTKTEFHNTKWWTGPEFLRETEEKWTTVSKIFQLTTDKLIQCASIGSTKEVQSTVFDTRVTNSFFKMKRIASYTLKFIKKTTKRLKEERRMEIAKTLPFINMEDSEITTITPEQLNEAERILIKDHQKSINQKDQKKWDNLGLITNEQGLIVCRGRLQESDLPNPTKFPILINPKTQMARMIIQDSHSKFHKTTEHTMDSIRRKFWIPQLRQQTKSILRKCTACQRMSKQACKYPNMGQMPKDRVRISRPFANVGVDNFGPITIKNQDGSEGTAFGTIFTCAVTRLVHIELAKDTSAREFLNSLRKFVAIRGLPDKIVSDNGTNFVLSQKIISDTIKLSPEKLAPIEWKFITPYSPWKGGFYERLIKSIKHIFWKKYKKSKMTTDELQTVLYEIAAAVNSRPLTTLEDDVNCGPVIRPIDFINGQMRVVFPIENIKELEDEYKPDSELNALETKMGTVEALKSSMDSTSKAWAIWQSKYLAELREHHKLRMDNKRGSPKLPKVGQVVLICDVNQPRNTWKLGRITELIHSNDEIIREVYLITDTGRTLNRSINQIVPLEIDDEQNEELVPEEPTSDNPEPPDPVLPRYNMRIRKPVVYNEDIESQKTRPPKAAKNNVNSSMLMMTIIITSLIGQSTAIGARTTAMSPPLDVKCTPTGLKIIGKYKKFEACTETFCTSRARLKWNGDNSDIWIPPAIKMHPHHASIKISDGKDVKIWEMDCQAIDFCDTIDCTFCLSNILNPECNIMFAILGLGGLGFAMMMIIHSVCNVPFKLGDVFRMIGRIILGILIICGQIIQYVIRKLRGTRQRRPRWKGVLITLILILGIVKSCQEVDIVHQYEKVCDTDGNCKIYTEELINLNQFKMEGCLRIEKNGTVIKDIRVQLAEVELRCVKKTVTYTQEIATKVYSSKRCPGMGSCQDEKCSNITRTSIVPELDKVNNMTGITACVESCGGPGCGCFYISSGCLFYRIYAEPLDNEAIEIFSCIDYQTRAGIIMTVTTLNSWSNKAETIQIKSAIGQSVPFKNIVITVDSIQIPPTPVLNTWFIKRDKGTATWPQNLWPNFICDKEMKKCRLEEECQCSPAEKTIQCTCKDTNIKEHMLQTDTHLPTNNGHVRIEQENDTIVAKIKSSIGATISLKSTDKWNTKIVKSIEECSIETSEVKGCYSCSKGATAEVKCFSSHEDTIGNVECGDEVFAVKCTKTGQSQNITFLAEYAKFARRCSVDCGGKKKQKFEIHGILKYSGSVWTTFHRILEGNTTIYNEFNFPDFGHLWKAYLTYVGTVITVLLIVVLIFVLTYSTIMSMGWNIITSVGWIFLTILRKTLAIGVRTTINLVRKYRGHIHLHQLIILTIMCQVSLTYAIDAFQPTLSPKPTTKLLLAIPQIPFAHTNFVTRHIITLYTQPTETQKKLSETDNRSEKMAHRNEDTKIKDKKGEKDLNLKITAKHIEHTSIEVMEIGRKLDMIPQKSRLAGGPLSEREAAEADSRKFLNGQGTPGEEPTMDKARPYRIPKRRERIETPSRDRKDLKSRTYFPTVKVPTKRQCRTRVLSKGERDTLIKSRQGGVITCAFCTGGHYSDNCIKYIDAKDRINRLRLQRICENCLQGYGEHIHQHRCKDKTCWYCGEIGHHTAVCETAPTKMIEGRRPVPKGTLSHRSRSQGQFKHSHVAWEHQTQETKPNRGPRRKESHM